MRGGDEGLAAYQGEHLRPERDGGICPSTRGQIGWRATRNGTARRGRHGPDRDSQAAGLDGSTATVAGVATREPLAARPQRPGSRLRSTASASSCRTTCSTASTAAPGTPSARPGRPRPRASASPLAALGSGTDPLAPTRHVVKVQATTGTTAASSLVAWSSPTPVTSHPVERRGHHRAGRQGQADRARLGDDDPQQSYPIALPARRRGRSVPGGAHKTVTTGAGGRAVVAFTPRFTTTFRAAFQPGRAVAVPGGHVGLRRRGRARAAHGARRRAVRRRAPSA